MVVSDPCGKAWDRLTFEFGRATEGASNAVASCRARRNVARCLREHGAEDGFVHEADEPFVCEGGGG